MLPVAGALAALVAAGALVLRPAPEEARTPAAASPGPAAAGTVAAGSPAAPAAASGAVSAAASGATSAATAAPVPGRAVPAPRAGDDVLAGADVRAAVAELARRRAEVLLAGDPEELLGVDAPGSPALSSDAALIAALHEDGASWRGLAFSVVGLDVESATDERAVVLADVVTGAHQVVDRDGGVQEVAAGAPRRSRLTLVRVEGQWRVSAIG